ncbi:MAG: type 1 glutamine amidotransferase, partial [Rubricoccaceae bacterium]|nr:type 1 glutamine amidotransferase [Rubricoccaceae bacterium]
CHDRRLPLFGSCWGHQFIARAFGGTVIHDSESAEMGTHEVMLTDEGQADPLFEAFPRKFWAQMGHQDRVSILPEGAVELATNDVAPYQAFRFADAPIYGTQFHSELDEAGERARLFAYRAYYPEMQQDTLFRETLESLRPTPDVDDLLFHFLEIYAVDP